MIQELEWLKEWMELVYIPTMGIPEARTKVGIVLPWEKTYFPRTFKNFDAYKRHRSGKSFIVQPPKPEDKIAEFELFLKERWLQGVYNDWKKQRNG